MSTHSRPKVFISGRFPEKGRALLEAACEVTQWDSGDPPPRQTLLDQVKGKDGFLCFLRDKINDELLDAAGPSLKVLSTMSVGYDHIDLKECKARNIKVGYTPDVLTKATAELTIGLLLAAARRFKEAMHAVESGGCGPWSPVWMCGQGLDGATVGIVGLGHIGLAVARCLQPFGVEKILYTGRSEKPEASQYGISFATFDDLLSSSDFVIACCALTPDTKNMFNSEAFKKMKPSSVFVNTSRGGVVNQDELYEALKSGQIAAAGLDVTTPEPLPTDSPLLSLKNCLILPHIGSATYKAREAMAVLAARNLIAALKNESMPNQLQ